MEISFEEFMAELYDEALKQEQANCHVTDYRVIQATRGMIEAYKPDSWTSLTTPKPCDYDDPAYRCAYLHKYAACHSSLVCEMLLRAAQEGPALDHLLVGHGPGRRQETNLCCLGGGPGVDVVAYLALLELVVQDFNGFVHAQVVDCHGGWKHAFDSVVQVLKNRNYGSLARLVSNRSFQCDYVQADLLQAFQPATRQAIESADLLTMVKFVSAAACRDTDAMITNIFSAANPGALVLFVDNAAGGFHEMACRAASRCGLQSVYGPLQHEHYEHVAFRTQRFGSKRLSGTKVAVQIWRKGVQPSKFAWEDETLANRRAAPLNRMISVKRLTAQSLVAVQDCVIALSESEEDENKDSCCVIS